MKQLTSLDRAAAVEAMLADIPFYLQQTLRKGNVEEAEELLRQRLWANRVGPTYESKRVGEPHLLASPAGLIVNHQGRSGVLYWQEIAEALAANEFDSAEEDSIAGEIDLRDDEDANLAIEYVANEIPVDAITTSPRNPRKHFDEAKLRELGESIRATGLAQPIVVRLLDDGAYELVAGERRWRAAKLIGLKHIAARIGTMNEAQADELRIVENLQREDLSAIEEALGFREMIQTHGYTQTQLAARMGCSQGHVGNRLRLLNLPDVWQTRVITREIPATHARAILPYVEHPKLLDAIEKTFYAKGKLREELPSVEEFTSEVDHAVRCVTEDVSSDRRIYSCTIHDYIRPLKLSAAEKEELQIVLVEGCERAVNTALAEKLKLEDGASRAAEIIEAEIERFAAAPARFGRS